MELSSDVGTPTTRAVTSPDASAAASARSLSVRRAAFRRIPVLPVSGYPAGYGYSRDTRPRRILIVRDQPSFQDIRLETCNDGSAHSPLLGAAESRVSAKGISGGKNDTRLKIEYDKLTDTHGEEGGLISLKATRRLEESSPNASFYLNCKRTGKRTGERQETERLIVRL